MAQRNTRQRTQAAEELIGSQPSEAELSSSQQTNSSNLISSQSSSSQSSTDDSSHQKSDDCVIIKIDDPDITFQSHACRANETDSGNVSLQTTATASADPVLECKENLHVAGSSSEEDVALAKRELDVRAKSKRKAAAKPSLLSKVASENKNVTQSCNNKPKKEKMISENSWDVVAYGERFREYEAPPADIYDPDRLVLNDPSQSGLYARDIFFYYRLIDHKFRPSKYMDRHPELSYKMRALLIDWMVEVQETMELNHETLYVGVRLVDLHLSRTSGIKRLDLQLLGCTALIIAAKMDDRLAPPMDDYVYAVDDAYSKRQIMRMEREMLVGQNWELCIPTAYRVLRRYSKVARCEMKLLTLARYVLESSLLDYELSVSATDHELAAGCLYLAMRMLQQLQWDKSLKWHTGFTEKQLLPMAKRLNANLKQWNEELERSVQTIHHKYSHHLFHEVARVRLLTNEELSAI